MTVAVLDYIQRRTEEVGNCLEWTGPYSKKSRYPIMRLDGEQVGVRPTYWKHLNAKPVPHGLFPVPSCGNFRCVCHLVLRTKGQIIKAAYKAGTATQKVRIEKIARSRQAAGKLDWGKVEIIRSGGSAEEQAKLFGVSPEMIRKVRRFECWVPRSGYSVFNQL